MKPLILLLLALSARSSVGLDCGDGLIRGVNLGGWLMMEPWITPSIFEEVNVEHNDMVVDEYTYAQLVDPVFAKERLERHWDEFYTRADLATLAASGISHLRVPIGYWLVDVSADEPFPPPPASDDEGQRFYLKRLIGWCDELGLKVWIDLHGAPESQNGYDNSGRRGSPNWLHENDPSYRVNVDRTHVILEKVADLMASWIAQGAMSESTLFGIDLLNEPQGGRADIFNECKDRFYPEAYDRLRPRLPNDAAHKIGIQLVRDGEFDGYMSEADGYKGVLMSQHVYHCFGGYWNDLAADRPAGWTVNLDTSCAFADVIVQQTLPNYVGEWSLAVSDCQKYLAYPGYANPYVAPDASVETCQYYNGDFSSYADDYKEFLGQFMRAQMDGYEAGAGWFFWTGKTENNCAPEWDYLFLLENGIAPANLCEREAHCSFAKES